MQVIQVTSNRGERLYEIHPKEARKLVKEGRAEWLGKAPMIRMLPDERVASRKPGHRLMHRFVEVQLEVVNPAEHPVTRAIEVYGKKRRQQNG